jgi:hypothetical protein
MSRIDRKIESKKKKRQLSVFIVSMIFFLMIGLFAVDYTLRDVLALDHGKMAGYESQPDKIIIYFFGESLELDRKKIYFKVEKGKLFMEEKWDRFQEEVNQIKNKL